RLLLIRHGQTQANLMAQDPPMTGHSDPPLNATGRDQAQKLGVALCNEPISTVFSSPLQRALHTARYIADRCGAEVTPVDGLREMDCGELEGEAISSVRDRLSEL